uniref:Uncharacterized protein n=1 Tax=Arundo donax TaxID=35708 RepID=A0A0A9HS26_ARUDO
MCNINHKHRIDCQNLWKKDACNLISGHYSNYIQKGKKVHLPEINECTDEAKSNRN